jgi:hypothetical protein
MLERDGSVIVTTGPVRSNDARLRRGQALALQSGAGLEIARELISKKLAGQERVAREKLHNAEAANTVAQFRNAVSTATRRPAWLAHLFAEGKFPPKVPVTVECRGLSGKRYRTFHELKYDSAERRVWTDFVRIEG